MPGFGRLTLARCIETPGSYLLLVEWDRLEDHMDLGRFYPNHRFVAEYLGCTPSSCPARYRAASPVNHVDRTDPPTLLVTGTAENVPLAQPYEMGQQARRRASPVSAPRDPGTPPRRPIRQRAVARDPSLPASTRGLTGSSLDRLGGERRERRIDDDPEPSVAVRLRPKN